MASNYILNSAFRRLGLGLGLPLLVTTVVFIIYLCRKKIDSNNKTQKR